jgi:hypothetical protein
MMKTETEIELEQMLALFNTRKLTEEESAKLKELYEKREAEWKASGQKSSGVGDTIKKVTDKLGIKQCGGCKRRQAILNQMFPYK